MNSSYHHSLKRFKEILLNINVGSSCPLTLPVLVNNNIDLSLYIDELDSLLDEFQHSNCSFTGRFDRGTNFIPINGIIGLDFSAPRTPLS